MPTRFPVFFRESQAMPSRGVRASLWRFFFLHHPSSQRVPATPAPHSLTPKGAAAAADPIAEGEPRWCGRGGRGDAAGWWPLHKGLSVCGTPAVPRPSFRPSFLIPGPVKGLFVRRRRWLAPDTGSRAAFFALEAARARRSCSRACILLPGLAPLGREGHPCPQPVTGPWCSGTRPMARSCSGQPGCLPAPQPALAGRRGHRGCGMLTEDAPCPTTVPSHLCLHGRWEPPATAPKISPLHPRRSHPHLRRQTSHLPRTPLSLPASQLFFLLFSASCYPAAKNNQEFTALDLELSPAQLSPLRAVSAEPGLSPGFPCLGSESTGMLRAGHVEGLRCTVRNPEDVMVLFFFFFGFLSF